MTLRKFDSLPHSDPLQLESQPVHHYEPVSTSFPDDIQVLSELTGGFILIGTKP